MVKKHKPWRPDWSLEREVVRIESDDESYETFDEIEVVEEENGFFRLYEYPFAENLQWGDLIQAERSEEGVLCFLSFVERPDYEHRTSILSSKVAGTGENSFVEKNQKYLKELMDAGGFWQLDMGGVLTTITPPGFNPNSAPIASEDGDNNADVLKKKPRKTTRDTVASVKLVKPINDGPIYQALKRLDEEEPLDHNKIDWDVT